MCFITEDKIRKVFEDLLGPPVTANPEIRSCVDRVDMIIREDVRTRVSHTSWYLCTFIRSNIHKKRNICQVRSIKPRSGGGL